MPLIPNTLDENEGVVIAVGFMSRLFGGASAPNPYVAGQRPVGAGYSGSVIVVGTEYRQPAVAAAIKAMAGGETLAFLEAEPSNPHDRLAVRVIVAGATIGYLSATQARRYQSAVALAAQRSEFIAVRAYADSVPGSSIVHLKLRLPDAKDVVRELETAYAAG